MPILSDIGGKNLAVGRGRLFFARFTPAQVAAGIVAATMPQGERYMGNTPGFSLSSQADNLDHFDSDSGVKVKDNSLQLTLNRSGTIETDNIDANNLALLFLSDGATTASQTAQTAQTFVITGAATGLFYQVGATTTNPSGVRKISNVTVKKGAGFTTTVTQAGNYEVDEDLGRIYVLPGSAGIPDNTDIQINYDQAATTRVQIISKSTAIYGALHYVADNPIGVNRDLLCPYVKLAPNGDFNLKGDDWLKIAFTVEVLKKASNIESVYIDGRAA